MMSHMQALLNAAIQRHLNGGSESELEVTATEAHGERTTSAWQINGAQFPSLGFGGADWSLDSKSPGAVAAWSHPLPRKSEEKGSSPSPSPTLSNNSPSEDDSMSAQVRNASNNGNNTRRDGNGSKRGGRNRTTSRINVGQRRSPITARAPVWASSDWHPAANLPSSPPSGSPGTPSKGSGTGVFLPLALRQQMEKEQQMQSNNNNQHDEGQMPCSNQASKLNKGVGGGVSA